MNMNFLGAAAVTTAMLVAAPAVAATVIFDDFSGATQSVEDVPNPGQTNSGTVPFGAGTRELSVMVTQGNGTPLGDASLEVSDGLLRFSTDDGVTAMGKVMYTNVGDISNGSNPYFFFEIGSFDGPATFSARAVDTLGGISTYTETLGPLFSPFLFFSQFAGAADFNILSTLAFKIDTTNVAAIPGFFAGGPSFKVDGSLDSISLNAVPLPAAGFLLFGALGGMAALRRRKSRKAA